VVDYGVRTNLNNLVAPIAVFLYKLKNELPLELCLAVIIMQYGPNLPEHYSPNGQVPNYLPIPFPPTYNPTTQHSDMIPPLTMQYEPTLPEHYAMNAQVPNYLPESYPGIQHGGTMAPMHLSDPPRMPADAMRRPMAQPMTNFQHYAFPEAVHPRNNSFQHSATGSAFHSYARAPFTSVPPPLQGRNAGAPLGSSYAYYAPQQARYDAQLPLAMEYREDVEADERAARMHFGSHANPEAIGRMHDTDANRIMKDMHSEHWERCKLSDMMSEDYADTMLLPRAPRRTAAFSRDIPGASTSKAPGSNTVLSTKKSPSAWHSWMGFTSDRPLLTAKQYEVLYAKLIERRPRDRQENDAQYQVHVKLDAMSIADELAEAEKQRKKSRKRETARLLKIQEQAAIAEALACPTQRTKNPIDFYTSDGLPNVSPEIQSAYLDHALWVDKGVVASKSPPLAKNPKKKKKLPALQV